MAERVLARIVAEGAQAPGLDPARLPEPGRFERARAWARSRLDWFEGPGGAGARATRAPKGSMCGTPLHRMAARRAGPQGFFLPAVADDRNEHTMSRTP